MRRMKITAMIPAKLGSTRLPMKNLALIRGRPLIYYPIQAAKESGAFSKIIINAEDAIFARIAKRYGVDFYRRPKEIISPTTKTDTVVYDFILKNPCDIVAWVSPIAPLQPAEEVRRIVEYFVKERLDSLMTVKDKQTHCIYKNKPVNFSYDGIFAQTQDLTPVKSFVYSMMMWRSETFKRVFEKNGYALLCGKLGFFSVSKPSSIIVKRKEDLILADLMMRSLGKNSGYNVCYDRVTNKQRR